MPFVYITAFLSAQVLGIHVNRWKLDKKLGVYVLLLYAIFLCFSILIEYNIFTFVNLPMCQEVWKFCFWTISWRDLPLSDFFSAFYECPISYFNYSWRLSAVSVHGDEGSFLCLGFETGLSLAALTLTGLSYLSSIACLNWNYMIPNIYIHIREEECSTAQWNNMNASH